MSLIVHLLQKRPLCAGRIWCGLLAIAGSALGTGLAQAQTAVPQAPLQQDVKATCTVSSANFAGWFKSGSVSLNGEVNPANSVTFPNNSNCSFYLWSQQMFLWLTSPAPSTYGGGGRVFESPVFYDVSGPDGSGNRVYIPHQAGTPRLINVRSSQVGPHGLQTLFDARGKMFEVVPAPLSVNGNSMVRNSAGQLVEVDRVAPAQNGKLTFLDRQARKISIPAAPKLDTTLALRAAPRLQNLKASEASTLVQGFRSGRTGEVVFMDVNGNQIVPTQGQAGDGGVLLAQNGSLVYYATMVNDVFAYFQTGTVNGGIPPPASTPASASFPTTQSQLNTIVAYAQSKGTTIPDPEALAIEVKTAWIEPIGLDSSKYITTTAVVPTYDQSNPSMWVPNGTKSVTLILVGMHVVGSAQGHPEMIWATYEHFTNSPWSTFTYLNSGGQTKTVTQASSGTWLLSSTNNPTANYNVQRMSYAAPNIVAASGSTIGASDTIRWKTWGSMLNATNPNATAANTDVMSINNSVITQLLAGDLRAQYMMTGSTWTIGGAAPTSTNQVGTNQLANATMETYQQGSSPQGAGSNCFTCHTSNNVGVSHIFLSLKPLFPQ